MGGFFVYLGEKRIMRGHKRKLPADTFEHIYIRSINQFVIFYSMEDRLVYYTVFAVMAKRYRVTVLALALMFDHIHHLIKTISRELYSKFIGVTTSTFVMAYNRDSGRKGPLFHKAYGNSAKRRDKDVRNCIAYNYNNSVEKLLFIRAEQDRWNLLAYIDNPHPFSKEICRKTASKKLLKSMDTVVLFRGRNEYLDYPVVRRLFEGLVPEEREQLLDFIIYSYLPIDKESLLGFYKNYDAMVLAINSNTGKEYDMNEIYDPESHQDFVRMLNLTQRSSFADDPRSIILAPDEQKWKIVKSFIDRAGASLYHAKRFLHLE
jgi:REP element-mobilizing transposase RayT